MEMELPNCNHDCTAPFDRKKVVWLLKPITGKKRGGIRKSMHGSVLNPPKKKNLGMEQKGDSIYFQQNILRDIDTRYDRK